MVTLFSRLTATRKKLAINYIESRTEITLPVFSLATD
jgi:hypothetical protein